MPFDEGRYREPNDTLEKLDKVIALLATEDRWCKFFGLSSDGRRCLWGALWAEDAAALLEVPVLRAIRQVTGFLYESIDALNDHAATTHSTILAVLYRARQDLSQPSARFHDVNVRPRLRLSELRERFVSTEIRSVAARSVAREGFGDL
jgi:hypothetical protein